MRVSERYVGRIGDERVDETHVFLMRCWTANEVRDCVTDAAFANFEVQRGADAGIAKDRLFIAARR